jgi:hypothetical protein
MSDGASGAGAGAFRAATIQAGTSLALFEQLIGLPSPTSGPPEMGESAGGAEKAWAVPEKVRENIYIYKYILHLNTYMT